MTEKARTVTEIAEAIRATGGDRRKMQALMATLYAETIVLDHTPPQRADGHLGHRGLLS